MEVLESTYQGQMVSKVKLIVESYMVGRCVGEYEVVCEESGSWTVGAEGVGMWTVEWGG